jgi:hypothetical protein
LDDTEAIPHDKEDDPAKGSKIMHPASQGDGLTVVGGPQFTAGVSFVHKVLQDIQRRLRKEKNIRQVLGFSSKHVIFICFLKLLSLQNKSPSAFALGDWHVPRVL